MLSERAVVFERATGSRLLTAAALAHAWPRLFSHCLFECQLAVGTTLPTFIALARFGERFNEADARRFDFWAETQGGRTLSPGADDDPEWGRLQLRLSGAEKKGRALASLLPAELARLTGFLAAELAAAEPRLLLDLRAPRSPPHSYDAERKVLYVPALTTPPEGDVLPVVAQVPGRSQPLRFEAKVLVSRPPELARPGQPAGFELWLAQVPADVSQALATHFQSLEPPKPERRASPRYDLLAPVTLTGLEPAGDDSVRLKYGSDDELASDYVANLSFGGAFIRTTRPYRPMTQVTLSVELPNGEVLQAAGTVVNVQPGGIGVQFKLDEKSEQLLAATIAKIGARHRPAPAPPVVAPAASPPPPPSRSAHDAPVRGRSAPAPENAPPDEKRVFGRYEILSLLGQGGMSQVYRARSLAGPRKGQTVAVKRLLPHLEKDPTCVDLFTSEADLSRLLDHPNIVKVFDVGLVGETYYMAMDLVEGEDLAQLLSQCRQRGIRLPVDFAVYVAKVLSDALAHAHAAKSPDGRPLDLVHGDVSPANLFVSREGQIILGDFGLARGRNVGGAAGVAGKPSYLSPEALGGVVSREADLWAAGVTLYELLTGERPFVGGTPEDVFAAIARGKCRPVRSVRPEVSPELERVVHRALARKRSERFANAPDLGAALTPLFDPQVGTPLAIAAVVRQLTAQAKPS